MEIILLLHVEDGDDTITFNVDAAGHPFYIKTVQGTGNGNNQASGVTWNQGSTSGEVKFLPQSDGTYYYQCELP